jgi:hypothetical protein
MKMRWILGCAALLMGSALTMTAGGQTSAPAKDDLFSGTEIFAKGATDVTEITMDPDTLGLVNGKDGKRAHNMILNVVRTYEYDKPGMYRIEDVDAFRNKLNTGDWHCSIHTRDLKNGESTDVCSKRRTDDLSETAIITVEPKELTFIHTIRRKGDSESDMSGLPMLLGMPGFSNLAMLDPDAFADMAALKMQMRLGKGGMILNGKPFDFQMNMDMKNFSKLDSKEMKLKFDRSMKDAEKAQRYLKQDTLTPEQPEAPEKLEAPEMPPPAPAPAPVPAPAPAPQP